jgi:hypothetical protein
MIGQIPQFGLCFVENWPNIGQLTLNPHTLSPNWDTLSSFGIPYRVLGRCLSLIRDVLASAKLALSGYPIPTFANPSVSQQKRAYSSSSSSSRSRREDTPRLFHRLGA